MLPGKHFYYFYPTFFLPICKYILLSFYLFFYLNISTVDKKHYFVPQKCEMIMVLSNCSFSNIAIALLNFSLLLIIQLLLLIFFALPLIAKTTAFDIVGRGITILGSTEKRSHESIYKIDIKNKQRV